MGNAIIEFNGICTYVSFDQFAPELPAYGRRIVLANGNRLTLENSPYPQLQKIEPHIARLRVPATSTIVGPAANLFFPDPVDPSVLMLLLDTIGMSMDPMPAEGLQGATLQLVGPIGGEPLTESSAWCLPHLSASLQEPARPGAVITNKDAAVVAAYFDLTTGTLSAIKTEHGQAITQLHVSTIGAPQLLITPFDGSAPTLVTLLTVPENDEYANVVVMNEPTEPGKDADLDFLLHFVVTDNQFPPKIGNEIYFNTGSSCPLGSSIIHWEAGPGCSNSGIP